MNYELWIHSKQSDAFLIGLKGENKPIIIVIISGTNGNGNDGTNGMMMMTIWIAKQNFLSK